MTNYNDGNWHGWNNGDCPVHIHTRVDYIWKHSSGVTYMSDEPAGSLLWESNQHGNLIAFRVVKEYKEGPREWWVNEYPDYFGFFYHTREEAEKNKVDSVIRTIKVREVIE